MDADFTPNLVRIARRFTTLPVKMLHTHALKQKGICDKKASVSWLTARRKRGTVPPKSITPLEGLCLAGPRTLWFRVWRLAYLRALVK